MALALAIYLGYEEIQLYGSELSSSTEYYYQATNYAFWIGLAHGRGIRLELKCWESEFFQPIYGFEGEAQLDKSHFEGRFAEQETAWKNNDNLLSKLKNRLDGAMLEAKFDEVARLSLEMEALALTTGETSGAMGEAQRYSQRGDPISRQEFERVSAKAQIEGQKLQTEIDHASGKCEYVWNVWKQTGRLVALNQLRAFLKEKMGYAYDTGIQLGIFHENMHYIHRYDELVMALGGERAVWQVEKSSYSGKPELDLREVAV
jgi:hypothetical protein